MEPRGALLWDVSSLVFDSPSLRDLRGRMLSLVLPRLGSSDLIMAVGETARTATVEELAMNNYDVPYGTDLADAFRLTVDHLEGLSGFVRVLMVISSPPTITRSREGHRLFNWPPLAEAAAATAEQAARLAARVPIDVLILIVEGDGTFGVVEALRDLPFRHRWVCSPHSPSGDVEAFLDTVGWPRPAAS